MKKLPKLIGFIFALLLAFPAFASAQSTPSVIENALANLIANDSDFAIGTKKPSGHCWKFINSVSQKIFGAAIPNGTAGQWYLAGYPNYTQNWDLIDSGHNTTNARIKGILQQAHAGDIVQYRNDRTNPQHTIMIYSTDANGITIYESTSAGHPHGQDPNGNWYQSVQKHTYTWSEVIPVKRGTFEGNSTYGLSLYRCKRDVIYGTPPTLTPTPTPTPIPVSTPTPTPVPPPAPSVQGDYDCSGIVNIQDAILTLQAAMGLIIPSEQSLLNADTDTNGTLSVTDAINVLRMAMSLYNQVIKIKNICLF